MVFTINTIWEWQKVKNYWKKWNKKFCGFFSIWRHPRKGVVQSFPNVYFQKRWFLLANTTWKWQQVKNYWKKEKKCLGGFFPTWRHPRKGVVRSSIIFNNFLEQLSNSWKIRLRKFQVSLVIFKKNAFLPPPPSSYCCRI